MPYIGNQSGTTGFSKIPAKQDLTGATGTSLTLTHAVASAEGIDLFINNVRQEPTEAYSVGSDGVTVTLTGSVVATDDIYVVYNSLAQQTGTHPSNQALQATSGAFSSNVDVGGSLLVDTIKDGAGTNTAMTIDSTGRILTPQRPLFKAGLNTTRNAASVGTHEAIVWSNEIFDVGNNWDNTEFTAPIAGMYYFYFTILTPNNALQMNYQIRQDSGSGMSPQLYARNAQGTSSQHETVSASTVLNLSVGHKVDFAFDRAIYGDGSTYWSSCGGYLLG